MSGPTAAFGPLNLGSSTAITGLLSPAHGGTGVNNGANALTVPASITALGRSSTLVAGRVPFASDGNNLTDDSLFAWNNTNKHLYVGGTPASDIARLGITNSDTDASNTTLGLFLEHTFSSASALTAAKRGLQFNVYLDGSGGGSGSGAALFCSVQNRQTAGTIADLTAISADARTNERGQCDGGLGRRIRPVLSGAGISRSGARSRPAALRARRRAALQPR